MNKKPTEPDEMRMPADKFDEMMREALRVVTPAKGENGAKRPVADKQQKTGLRS